jgi:hemerythrin
MTDVLTGLLNRRHATTRLSPTWANSLQEGSLVACILIDADGFKQINDQQCRR